MSKAVAYLSLCASFLLLVLATPAVGFALSGGSTIQATINHPFVVSNTTLPPGKYDFRIRTDTEQQIMTVSGVNGSPSVEFLVRTSRDNHVPHQTELVFDRYGKTEVLTNIYGRGSQTGVAIIDASHEVSQLKKKGEKPQQHTEQESQ
jgi:hypothetical protein